MFIYTVRRQDAFLNPAGLQHITGTGGTAFTGKNSNGGSTLAGHTYLDADHGGTLGNAQGYRYAGP